MLYAQFIVANKTWEILSQVRIRAASYTRACVAMWHVIFEHREAAQSTIKLQAQPISLLIWLRAAPAPALGRVHWLSSPRIGLSGVTALRGCVVCLCVVWGIDWSSCARQIVGVIVVHARQRPAAWSQHVRTVISCRLVELEKGRARTTTQPVAE